MRRIDFQISDENLNFGAALHEIVCDDAGMPVDYRFLDVNPAFERLTGLSRDRVVGKTVLEIIPGIEPSWIERYGEVALTGTPAHFEAHAAAMGRWYEVSAYSPGKNRFVALFSDVTDRRRIEESLRKTERILTQIETIANMGHWKWDVRKNTVALSDGILRIFGVAPEGVDSDPDRIIERSIHPEDRDKVRGMAETVLSGRRSPGPLECRVVRPDGTIRTVVGESGEPLFDAQGALTSLFGIVRDITDQKNIEQALRESEERFRHIVDSAPMMIFIVCDDRIVFMNETGLALLGASSPEELIGKPVLEMVHPDSRNAIRNRIQRVVGERLPTSLMEQKYLRLDGSVLAVEAMAVPILYLGRPAIQVFVRDLTRQKAAEEALRRSQDQLRQAQKMEAVGRLAGGIAHDFNNLLTVILGYNSLMLRGLDEENPHRKEALAVKGAAERASSLTQQLLAFSRRQILQPKVVDLNQVVAGTESILRRIIGEDIELVTRLASDLGAVRVDPAQMEQVIVNLAVNSRDAMPRGGTILIETANAEADEALRRECSSPGTGPCVLLRISDTGTGMTDETKARAFEPFFTTKEVGKGTGLGLSMVYGIVEQNRGNIVVDSAVGRGTTISIYLPRVEGAVETAPDEMPAAGAGGQGTILLVEDEILVRDLARDILSGEGYRVIEAGNGDEALNLLRQDPPFIDLLLTDVVMPQMGGRELAERFQAVRPGIRVLFMSGYTDDDIAHKKIDAGTGFIQKPFSPAELIRKVRKTLGNEAP